MTPLEKAREAMAARRAAGEKIVRRNPLEQHLLDPSSRKKAMDAVCFDCVGGVNADGGYRRAIRDCGCPKCPLYSFRPYQRADEPELEEQEAA